MADFYGVNGGFFRHVVFIFFIKTIDVAVLY